MFSGDAALPSWIALERLAIGVVVVDERFAIRFANTSAIEAVASCLGETDCEPPLDQEAERARLGEILDNARSRIGQGSGLVSFAYGTSGGRLELCFVPPDTVFISNPNRHVRVAAQRLRALYDLTKAEARTASALASGRSVREIAADADITVGTARWLVKQVLQKTNSRSQAQAVGRMLTGLAALTTDGTCVPVRYFGSMRETQPEALHQPEEPTGVKRKA